MVNRNRPLAKSYRQSQEEESDEQEESNEETMETDSGQESSPPPVKKFQVHLCFIVHVYTFLSNCYTFWLKTQFKISGS